jgi:Family of unknown function (DUF5752)
MSGSATSARNRTAFVIRDCALVVLATGRRARLLQEFRDHLRGVEAASLYHHFWGGLLQPRFEQREYNNDFAAWIRHGIHDGVLAERLAALDPTHFDDLEDLRFELLELIDGRLDEVEYLAWAHATESFEFVRSQIVVFDTARRLTEPRELAEVVPQLSTSSIFYHFVDARRRTPGRHDDFRDWLAGFGEDYRPTCRALAEIDPYFGSLSDLRDRVAAALAATPGASR